MNIALLSLSIVAILCSIYVLSSPKKTLPVFFVWVGIADLGKRLLWAQQNAQPTFLEYSLALLLPDLILIAGAGRLMFDCFIRRQISYRFHWLDLPVALFFVWSMINVLNPGKSVYVGLAGFKSFQLYVLVYVAVRLYPGSPSQFVSSLKYPILGISLIIVVYGLYQAEFGFTAYELRWLSSGISKINDQVSPNADLAGKYGYTIAMHNIVRVFSTFASHEQFGFFLGFVAILLFVFSGNRYLQYGSMAVICLMLMRTLSRSSWAFTLTAACVLVAGNFLSRKNMRSIYALFLVGSMTAGYFFWNYYITKESSSKKVEIAQKQEKPTIDPEIAQKRESPGVDTEIAQKEFEVPMAAETLKDTFSGQNPPAKRTKPGEMTPPDAYSTRVFTVGTYEWRIYSFQSLISDPSWRRFFGNGTGSMWYAWRVDDPGTTQPSKEEVLSVGLPVPGKRILSHIGTIDIIYEQGILGAFLFLWLLVAMVRQSFIFLKDSNSEPETTLVIVGLALFTGIVFVNTTVATVLIFRPISAPFWFSIGLVAAATSKGAQRVADRQSSLADMGENHQVSIRTTVSEQPINLSSAKENNSGLL